jgi:hypothetical protein
MSETSDLLIALIVIGARLFVPLAIPRYPIPAGIAAMVLDGVDQTIFQTFTNLPLTGYQSYDKALDVYYLSIAYLSTLRNWTNLVAVEMSRFLFYYRLVGTLLFEMTHVRALLLFFPNTFEYFFLFYEAVRLRWNPRRMSAALVIGAAFFIWVFIKVPQEFWIHIAQLDVTDFIKGDLFGMPLDSSWSTVVAQNMGAFLVAAIVVVALIVAARWYIIHRLPPADWRFSFDVDAHGSDVSPAEAAAAQRAGAQRLWDAELFEKFALVSLVTIIFSSILPNTRATPTSIAIGVGLLIVANTALKEALVRAGVRVQSALVQFLLMALVNILLVATFVLLLPFEGGSIDVPALLFEVLLLTLLVTLHDRFRPYYQARRTMATTADAALPRADG